MLSKGGRISDEALAQLDSYSDLIECECPSQLTAILNEVRKFEAYTTDCIAKFPQDAATHRWLQGAAQNIDALLSNTILQLARMEGFISEENQFVPRETLSPKPKTGSGTV